MGQERLRNEFMKQEKIPGFVWYIAFRSKYKYFVTEFIQNLSSLTTGIEPPKPWYQSLF
jgi:hypothetical protein